MFLTVVLTAAAAAPAPPPRLVGEPVELATPTGTLYGTIDLPPGSQPWPVVILHAGSGPTDRDGNGPLTRSNNLRMLGRALAARGVAVLRFDKRGIAASAKALAREEDIRLDTYAADVLGWAAVLRADRRFGRVGFVGHSEGALIGLVAAREARFDAFVSLCGPGRPLQEVLREQLRRGLPAELYKTSDAVIRELEAGREVKDTPKELQALFRPSVQPYLISTFRRDPAALAAGLKAPLLVASGSTDIQVSDADARRLVAARPGAPAVVVAGMNHVLKPVSTVERLGQLPSYTDPTVPLHPDLAPALDEFLRRELVPR
ncbi:MAG: alpha/beta fold hydrolase [Gemmataceae bacterium]